MTQDFLQGEDVPAVLDEVTSEGMPKGNRGSLWRVSENHVLPLYDIQTQISAGELTYDLISGRYLANYMFNKVNNAYQYGLKAKSSDFTPAALRTIGIR